MSNNNSNTKGGPYMRGRPSRKEENAKNRIAARLTDDELESVAKQI